MAFRTYLGAGVHHFCPTLMVKGVINPPRFEARICRSQ